MLKYIVCSTLLLSFYMHTTAKELFFAVPTIDPIPEISINEGDTLLITITGFDDNGIDNITWSIESLPSFVDFETNELNEVVLTFHPWYTDAGSYTSILVATDSDGEISEATFDIKIKDFDPNQRILINFTNTVLTLDDSNWNSTFGLPRNGNKYDSLINNLGQKTGVGIHLYNFWGKAEFNNLGETTGNDSGIYPDTIMSTCYYTPINNYPEILISGLDENERYNLKFFGSREQVTNDRTAFYNIGTDSVFLDAAQNSNKAVTLKNVQLTELPQILTKVSFGAYGVSQFGYLNAMEIISVFDSKIPPHAPKGTTTLYEPEFEGVTIAWEDLAFDEDSYNIYRSTDSTATFELIHTGQNNDNTEEFTDKAITGNTTYYYKISAVNFNGESEFSNTIAIDVPNLLPTITVPDLITVTAETSKQITLFAIDDLGEVLSFNSTDLPPFIELVDLKNDSVSLNFTPKLINVGFSQFTLNVFDDKGGSISVLLDIKIEFADSEKTFINFLGNSKDSPLPETGDWLNFRTSGKAGSSANTNGYNIELVDDWSGTNELGMITSGSSGIFEPPIILTALYESKADSNHLKISNLNSSQIYNFVFFNSAASSGNRTTQFSINDKTVNLNAAGNTGKIAMINQVLADENQEVMIRVEKGRGSAFAYLNALVIESHPMGSIPEEPITLESSSNTISSVTINWKDMSFREKDYQVWRSSNDENNFELIETLPFNTESFVDKSIQPDTHYLYKVRAELKDGQFTGFSDVLDITSPSSEIFINFNEQGDEIDFWNNTNTPPIPGATLIDLKNTSELSTGIILEIVPENLEIDDFGFTGSGDLGMTTGNDNGLFPDQVMQSYYYLNTDETAQLRLLCMDAASNYSFIFFASREASTSRATQFIINGDTVSLDAAANIDNTTQIDNIVPNSNGEVLITVSPGNESQFGYLNAMVIQSHGAWQVQCAPPTSLSAIETVNSITLSWEDESILGLGYEILKSDAIEGPYELLTTIDKGITEYIDNDLEEGITNYYFIKTIVESNIYTNSSDTIQATTKITPHTYEVLINFNLNDQQIGLWNNTNSALSSGNELSYLINDLEEATPIALEVLTESTNFNSDIFGFEGAAELGVNTGNNTGVFPDNVMKSFYYIAKQKVAQLNISCLDPTSFYRFKFFASRDEAGERTTVYSIGDRAVSLNASLNESRIAQMSNIVPDADGNVLITLKPDSISSFGYINAMVIQAFGDPESSCPVLSNETAKKELSHIYPNPFDEFLTITHALNTRRIQISDLSGRTIHEIQPEITGFSTEVNFQKLSLKKGVYLITVTSSKSNSQTYRIIKRVD